MKPSTKNEVAGTVHEVKGKAKEKAAQLTNNPDLEDKRPGREGRWESAKENRPSGESARKIVLTVPLCAGGTV
jgi:uncharacterized protein YjbJ (UPF0337 family)